MKIDVEGYEGAVLAGAEKTLANQKLAAIETEGFSPEVREILSKNGFQRYFYDPFSRTIGQSDFGMRPNNTLMIRNLEWVKGRVASAPSIDLLGKQL